MARATDRMEAARRRAPAVYVLAALVAFQGLSGTAGGFGLIADPTGRAIGLDPAWLDGSPFSDYFVPGVILLVVLGIGPLLAAMGILRRLAWAWPASLLVGAALIVWIVVEVAIVGYIAQPPLQAIYGAIGAAIVGVALVPAVRRELR